MSNNFEAFADLVRSREAKEFEALHNQNTAISCNYYARVPVFFHMQGDRYMTEVFMAFNLDGDETEDFSRIISTVCKLETAVRLCINLINSQISYAIGHHIRSQSMGRLLHQVIRHDMKNLGEAIKANTNVCLDNWEYVLEHNPDTIKTSLLEIRANTSLSLMTSQVDLLWQQEKSLRADKISIRDLHEDLEITNRFSQIEKVVFDGDWEVDAEIPKAMGIIMSNLIRNAMGPTKNKFIKLGFRSNNNKLQFTCASEAPIGIELIERYFTSTLTTEPPVDHRGIWFCRHIAQRLLNGRLIVVGADGIYHTVVLVEIPTD